MYCSTCASQLAPGLSYCNRCGASVKERAISSSKGAGAALLTAITLIALGGLGIVLGGALVLTKGADLPVDVVGIFMVLTFLLVGIVEVFLCKQLSRIISQAEKELPKTSQPQTPLPNEIRGPQQRVLPEPIPSVTENTTRTLEYSRDEALRR